MWMADIAANVGILRHGSLLIKQREFHLRCNRGVNIETLWADRPVQHPLDTGRRRESVVDPASLVKDPDFNFARPVNMVDPLHCHVFNQDSHVHGVFAILDEQECLLGREAALDSNCREDCAGSTSAWKAVQSSRALSSMAEPETVPSSAYPAALMIAFRVSSSW